MKVSLSWLKNYLPGEYDVQRLADGLTMVGLEVDAVTERYAYLDAVIVGRIAAVSAHPNADRLTCCQVDTGKGIARVVQGVEVSKVNTLNRPGKKKRTRGTNRVGSKPATKRAIVTLAAGEIPLFEN